MILKIRKALGPNEATTKSKHSGYEIYRTASADGTVVQLAFTARFMLLAMGAKRGKSLRAFIDNELELEKGKKQTWRPAEIRKRLTYLTAYQHAKSAVLLSSVLDGMKESRQQSFVPNGSATKKNSTNEILEYLEGLLKVHHLTHIVSGWGLDAKQFRIRSIW